jgi:ribonucleoside-diphosphate reductase alpha chain
MSATPFSSPISQFVWNEKYRYCPDNGCEDTKVEDTWRRVARALASVETTDRLTWEKRFYSILKDFRFLPGGRILAGAGASRRVTLFNCFVMGIIEDSIDGIFHALKEGAVTMQQGGGIGCDFSTLRPHGTRANSAGTIASGPVSFMRIWDSMCATLMSTGNRRGAMMATLCCDHPDIEAFIDEKRNPASLRHLNLSVQISDEFMRAVQEDGDWSLVFPKVWLGKEDRAGGSGSVSRQWPGTAQTMECRVFRILRARDLWHRIMRATYNYAEPGVLFVDRINRMNNLWYCEHLTATNPCGEVPLPPYGACNLGSINLTTFVRKAYSSEAFLDLQGIMRTAKIATRMLDNVIDLSQFPLGKQREQAQNTRRIGLGITGLADALIMLGLRYDDQDTRRLASKIMRTICHTAYRTSIELARGKGAFPLFDGQRFLQGAFVKSLPDDLQTIIADYGLRNSHLIAIAPAGTISLLANNISSGLEPVFDFRYDRCVMEADGTQRKFEMSDFAWDLWQKQHRDGPLPHQFVTAQTLPPQAHLMMQAALQPFVDNAISKTINVPKELEFAEFQTLYDDAYALGLKGCTTFRPNRISDAVLKRYDTQDPSARCCVV